MEFHFTERLEVHLNERVFFLEATPTNVIVGVDEQGQDVEQLKFTARVFEQIDESETLANVGNTPKFESEEDAIQFGFDFVKSLVKKNGNGGNGK